jgi:hypothetical protein
VVEKGMREALLAYPHRSTSAMSMSLWSTCAALQLAAYEDFSLSLSLVSTTCITHSNCSYINSNHEELPFQVVVKQIPGGMKGHSRDEKNL